MTRKKSIEANGLAAVGLLPSQNSNTVKITCILKSWSIYAEYKSFDWTVAESLLKIAARELPRPGVRYRNNAEPPRDGLTTWRMRCHRRSALGLLFSNPIHHFKGRHGQLTTSSFTTRYQARSNVNGRQVQPHSQDDPQHVLPFRSLHRLCEHLFSGLQCRCCLYPCEMLHEGGGL